MPVVSSLRHVMDQRGGVALMMLLGFIGLAVPITIASIQTSSQLSRNSLVYDAGLTGMCNSGSSVEVALHEILSDPNFDDGLTPTDPSKTIQERRDDDGHHHQGLLRSSIVGQGLVVTKTVMPTSTPVDTPTTFTYTLRIKNEGTDAPPVLPMRGFHTPVMRAMSWTARELSRRPEAG